MPPARQVPAAADVPPRGKGTPAPGTSGKPCWVGMGGWVPSSARSVGAGAAAGSASCQYGEGGCVRSGTATSRAAAPAAVAGAPKSPAGALLGGSGSGCGIGGSARPAPLASYGVPFSVCRGGWRAGGAPPSWSGHVHESASTASTARAAGRATVSRLRSERRMAACSCVSCSHAACAWKSSGPRSLRKGRVSSAEPRAKRQ